MIEVKEFPKDLSAIEVDRSDPRRTLVAGLFREGVEVDGKTREFYTYICEGLLYNQPCLVVAPPDDVDTLAWLEGSGLVEFATRTNIFLHVLLPLEGGWRMDGSDAAYMNRVFIQINGRRSYVAMQDNIYALGIGSGATVAQQAVMKMMSEWSGLASIGDLSDDVFAGAAGSMGSQNTEGSELVVSASQTPVPVWMVLSATEGTNGRVVDFWKKTNNSSDEVFSNKWADIIHFPSSVCRKSQINENNIAQTRVSLTAYTVSDTGFMDALWAFLSSSCRHRNFGAKALRTRMDPDQYGFEKHTLVDQYGFARVWYEYVPQRVKELGRPAPLVVCMHGRGGTAESFISLSEMNRVAEERDFIVVFPEASVHQQKPGTLRNLLLWNGDYKGEKLDDVPFILSIIEDEKKRWPIDSSRIYACGQSSGGMMTSTLAQRAPEVFAAVAPWSALVDPDSPLCLPEKIEPKVPFFFLFGEKDWLCADHEHGELEYHAAKDIAAFLKHLMKLYGLDETPKRYSSGEISWYVYLDRNKVPMLTVGTVRDMSHANYPGESWLSWDLFLSRFSKVDGQLLYMGEKVD